MHGPRTRILVACLALLALSLFAYRILGRTVRQPLEESRFYDAVAEGRVDAVTLVPDSIGYAVRSAAFESYVLADGNLLPFLNEHGVAVTVEAPPDQALLPLLGPLLFVLLFGAVFLFFMHRAVKNGRTGLPVARSRAKLASLQRAKVTFRDVAGVEEAKHELQEIVEFLKEPDRFQRLGGKIPTGVLLIGPTGTGKTLLARAVAGEADVPFFFISGSDFVEMFVGVGASRVRDLFEQGRASAPCIVFVDEIDGVGRRRGTGVGGGHDEREQTLNQLLVELDGFSGDSGVIVLAATNRPDVLDPALLRPGRFDRLVVVDRPDVRGREEILQVHASKVRLVADAQLGLIARGTSGFSGAELANLVNEAALYAAGRNRDAVTQADLELARDKVRMGAERRSLVISDVEKRSMAFHEAGHAVLAHLLPGADPLHKVTIVPRGAALGLTLQLPSEDRRSAAEPDLHTAICVLLGGRVAEELQLDRCSSGAGNDFEETTRLAHRMVSEWGMSETLGPVAYGKAAGQIFLGREIARHRDHSKVTAAAIDREVRQIVMGAYDRARRLLTEQADALCRVAEALLVHETLGAAQVAALVRGESLPAVPAAIG